MKKVVLPLVLLVIILVYFFYPEKVITYPAGVTAPDQPVQMNLKEQKEWDLDDFHFNNPN